MMQLCLESLHALWYKQEFFIHKKKTNVEFNSSSFISFSLDSNSEK